MRLPSLMIPGLVLAAGSALAGGRLHGTVETTNGETHAGTIEWGGRGYWDEVLVAGRPLVSDEPDSAKREGFRFSIFGLRLFDADEQDGLARFAVPFGEVRAVETDGEGATIELKNGDRLAVRPLGSSLGPRLGRIVVVEGAMRVEVPWHRLRRVRFSSEPEGTDPPDRLWGTATTKAGKFTGLVRWDRDEERPSDELDGQSDGRDVKLPFAAIAAIAPEGPRAARVTLKSGEEMVLSGTNDVDETSRGLEIRAPDGIEVVVEWDALMRLELSSPPALPGYDRYGSPRRLHGTVRLRDGTTRSGRIVWDRDESYGFETLDGDEHGIDWSVPFAAIASIRPIPGGRSEVTLRDGRRLRLGGSNDVDGSNRGVVVEADGSTTVLSIDAIEEVVLD